MSSLATDNLSPRDAGFKYVPREAFMPYHTRTQRYAVLICHRRAGKTVALLNDTIVRALVPRPDNLRQQFAYICPTATQARAIAWAYLREFTACFAHCPGYKALEQHLSITLPDPTNVNKPGSTIMLLGAENAERIRGLYLDGCTVDEAADIAPYVISTIIRPALADRQGWLTISGTLKSPDDLLYTTYELSQKLPLLYFSMLLRADQSKIIPDHELQDLKATMSEEAFNVEMLCDVTKATTGRILLPYLNTKQVTRVPYDPEGAPIVIGWDLGIADAMAIWAMQMCGREPHLIHSYEASGQSLENFATHLGKQSWSRRIGAHLLPHDSKVRELGSGKSRLEVMRNLGFRNLKVVPRLSKAEQIEAARLLLPKCWFDEDETAQGRKALRNYSFKFDPDRKVFSQSPLHDQYSNACLVAGTSIKTTRGIVPIEDVMVGDQVITPAGNGTVMNAGPTKRATELIKVTLADGRQITGTPEHKFFTNRGCVPLLNLAIGDTILEGKSPLWRLFKDGARKWFLRLHALAARR